MEHIYFPSFSYYSFYNYKSKKNTNYVQTSLTYKATQAKDTNLKFLNLNKTTQVIRPLKYLKKWKEIY